jgi:hypothetical protein
VEGMALFPFILVKHPKASVFLIHHEQIHLRQQLELGLALFYVLYLGEYLFRLVQYRSHPLAYYNISFEREAFRNQNNLQYLKERRWYAFIRYYKA